MFNLLPGLNEELLNTSWDKAALRRPSETHIQVAISNEKFM